MAEDQTPATSQQPDAPKAANITITLPDEWTLGHYQAYVEGRMNYKRSLPEEQQSAVAVIALDYFGGKELIKKGFVHITGDEQAITTLKGYLTETDILKVPNSVVGLIVNKISWPLDGSFNRPFLG